MSPFEEVQIRDVSQIEDGLRNSFQAIKRDMEQLRNSIAMQANAMQELRQQLTNLRDDAILKDKYNLLQIRIGDLQGDVKAAQKLEDDLTALEKDIKSLRKGQRADLKTVAKKQKQSFKEYQRTIDEDVAFVNRKIEDHLVRFDERLSENLKGMQQRLNSEIRAMRTEVGKFSSILEENKKITGEMETIRKEMEVLQKKGGQIFEKHTSLYKKDLDGRLFQLKTAVETLAERQREMTDNVGRELANRITKDQVEKLVDDVNREFNSLKQLMQQEFAKVEDEFKKKGRFVRRKAMEKAIVDINDEFDKMRDKINYLETSKIAKNYFDQQLEELQADMENMKDEVVVLKQEAMTDKERRSELKAELKKLKRRVPKPRLHRRMILASTVLLIIAFTAVLLALATYYTGSPLYAKILIASGIILFVIGAILRISVAWKQKEEGGEA